jgi:hypothetical protein
VAESKEIAKESKTLRLTLPGGESAYFERRTTWEKPNETPAEGTNLRAFWSYLPRTEILDLSEQSTITLCF